MATILLITRDTTLPDLVQYATNSEGHKVVHIDALERLTDATRKHTLEMVVVDLTAFARDYSYVCKRVRGLPQLAKAPLLCLVQAGNAQEIAAVLDAGGDDCLRKVTLTAREMAARIRALLRRHGRPSNFAPLVLFPQDKTIHLYGRPIELTPTEYDLLETLAQNPGEYLTATVLLQQVWHYPKDVGDPALVRNHVRNLRRKLETDPERPRILTSAHGRGYTLSVNIQRR